MSQFTLSKREYLDKMLGCWLGKSIGGTLGAPYEPTRGAFDIDYYTVDLSEGMLPNDDLDLQLVWLNAAEKYKTEVDAGVLSEYWMLGIVPNWAEYGVAKNNLSFGIPSPSSGKYKNRFKDSNGAWIRSEIWACLAPGHPEIAVKYAFEDACVDHADEGVYGEIFFAAIESAAFVESDKFNLIDIGLSYIPTDCACAKAVRRILELYRAGLGWKEARYQLMQDFPGSFGAQWHGTEEGITNANWGYDTPNNIALTLIGWLYADNDFGKALCITTGCGEDADCTAGTLGAILGIIHGERAIPAKWKDPIGDEIKTKCINRFMKMIKTPKTLTELTKRTANLMPSFSTEYVDVTADDEGFITVNAGDDLMAKPHSLMDDANGWDDRYFRDNIPNGYVFRGHNSFFSVEISAPNGIELTPDSPVSLRVKIENATGFCGIPFRAEIRWLTADGVTVTTGDTYAVFVPQEHCDTGRTVHDVTLSTEKPSSPLSVQICEITAKGYPSRLYIPVTLVGTRG